MLPATAPENPGSPERGTASPSAPGHGHPEPAANGEPESIPVTTYAQSGNAPGYRPGAAQTWRYENLPPGGPGQFGCTGSGAPHSVRTECRARRAHAARPIRASRPATCPPRYPP